MMGWFVAILAVQIVACSVMIARTARMVRILAERVVELERQR